MLLQLAVYPEIICPCLKRAKQRKEGAGLQLLPFFVLHALEKDT